MTVEVMGSMTRFKLAARGSLLRVLTMVTIVLVAAWCWTMTTPDHKAADEQDQQQHDKIDSDGEDAWLSSLTR